MKFIGNKNSFRLEENSVYTSSPLGAPLSYEIQYSYEIQCLLIFMIL